MKKKSVFFLIALLSIVVCVALIPTLLSSGFVMGQALKKINKQISATLNIDTCSIGWRMGLTCNNVQYIDPEQGIDFSISRLTGSQGLLALIAVPKNLGTVDIYQPVLEVAADRSKPSPSSPDSRDTSAPGSTTGKKREKDVPPEEKGTKPFWENFVVQLQVHEGTVQTVAMEETPRVAVRNIDLNADLSGGTINFDLGMKDEQGRGLFAATGFANLPVRQQAILDALVTKIDLKIVDFQIESLLTTAAAFGDFPVGGGSLSTDLQIGITGIDDLKIKGEAGFKDLHLTGGFLGPDQPAFDNLHLDVDARRSVGIGWNITRFDLDADPGTVNASGEYGRKGGKLVAKGNIKLPLLFSRFPHLLKMRQGTAIHSGTLNFSMDLSESEGRLTLVAGARAEYLSGEHDGQPFVWNTPLSLAVNAEKKGAELQVHNLGIEAPFLRAQGKGNPKSFTLQASADLQQAFQELGKLFQLEWSGSGQLRLNTSSRELEEDLYGLDINMDISDFVLLRNKKQVVPKHHFVVDGSMKAPLNLLQSETPMDLQVTASTWPGSISLELEGLGRENNLPTARYKLDTELGLNRLADLLHNLGVLPPKTTVSGNLNLHSAGSFEDNTLVVRELDSIMTDVIFLQGKNIFKDKRLRVFLEKTSDDDATPVAVRKLEVQDNLAEFKRTGCGCSAINVQKKSIFLRNLQVESTPLQLEVNDLSVADWRQPMQSFSTWINADLSLGPFTDLLHNIGKLGEDIDLAGDARVVLQAGHQGRDEQIVDLNVQAGRLHVKRRQKTLLADETAHFAALLQGKLLDGDINLQQITLESGPLTVNAGGLLKRTDAPALELSGTMTPDLLAAAGLLEGLSGIKVDMAGKKSTPFSLTLPLGLTAAERNRRIRASLDLWVEHISWFGVDVRELSIPVNMEKGLLQTKLQGTVNQGQLTVEPLCNFTVDPAVLSVPEESQVFTGVQLQKPLVDGLLGKIHPLFGVMAKPSGTLDARLDSFLWPVTAGGAEQAIFVSVFDVSRVNLDSTGVLHEILGIFGLGDEKLELKDSTITCNGADGRINCSPVRLLVAGSEMVVSGSVGMDKTLDYLLQIPVTEELVGREGYRILEGTSVRVPIKGTIGEPFFNRDIVSSTLADLTKQAAGKAIEKQIEKIIPGLFEGLKF
ncbi:MAG: hypothetical protein GQ559_11155 [Desulfobulbaceae bacterium]|nr:hypothetical protein [Desulfobulbaceae bacterium]